MARFVPVELLLVLVLAAACTAVAVAVCADPPLYPPLPESGTSVDYYGVNVAASGGRLVAATYPGTVASDGEVVRVYYCDSWSAAANATCRETATLRPDGPNEYFGYGLAFSGRLLAVGAWKVANNYGKVYVYDCDEATGACVQMAQLAPAAAEGEEFSFGQGVAIQGTEVMVSSATSGYIWSPGIVTIFTCDVVNRTCALRIRLRTSVIRYGFPPQAPRLVGDLLIVGQANSEYNIATSRGQVAIFRCDVDAPTWTCALINTVVAPRSDLYIGHSFGANIIVSGQALVVANQYRSNDGGYVHVFQCDWAGNTTCAHVVRLAPSDMDRYRLKYGAGLALIAASADSIVFAAGVWDRSAGEPGYVDVYRCATLSSRPWECAHVQRVEAGVDGDAYEHRYFGVTLAGDAATATLFAGYDALQRLQIVSGCE